MFDGWGNFYFLLGSAAASLIGLMFVVTTLTRGRDPTKAERGQRLFMTPTVFNFAAVLTLSGIALMPKLTPGAHRWALAAIGGLGLAYALVVLVQHWRARREMAAHWSDPLCYGAAPVVVYVGFEASLLAAVLDHDTACDFVALSLLGLLLLAVRNAWDLITWMAPRSPSQ